MYCKAQAVYKNPRYKILVINEQRYILDMGGKSFWKILFPFMYWIFPNNTYKVNNLEIVEKIKTPDIEQKDAGGGLSILGGVVAILLANLLRPLANVFNIPSSPIVNAIIVLMVFLLVLLLVFNISKRCKKRINHVLDIEQYEEKQVWLRPNSIKQLLFIIFAYLFFLGFTTLAFSGFIYSGDVMILFMGTPILLVLLAINLITINGDTIVRFKGKEKALN
ncbi:DUF443 domain-containing protein [Oceanobacillus kimchii]|uniref:DUF443 family protein n=1 Tax=Oceanobacillus kimchii TaxID=746691 RepID=A0ABQ5TJJ9_9BACI|nr:DUF443 domain-containing protein [Oceanobacillus kimchii]GLO65764.1 DUF443 family protein [Oceanobacillus kimchii]